jgi:hypothetical protein
MNALKIFGAILLIVIGFGVIGFVVNGISTGNYAFWAPVQAKVERKVFENSPSYIQGFNTLLANDYQQYQQAKSDSDKQIIKNIIIVKYIKYKTSDVEDETLKNFLIMVRGY